MTEGREKYVGAYAAGYEDARKHRRVWQAEHEAVEQLLRAGPVLDVPVGTGRFSDLYADKAFRFWAVDISEDMLAEAQKRGGAFEYRRGSIFSIPYPDDYFGTAVCVRMLNWLAPEELPRAIGELARVAREFIVSIRFGRETAHADGGWTHNGWRFLEILSDLRLDLWVEQKIRIDGEHPDYWMLRIRQPSMDDLLAQFRHGWYTPQGLARMWAERYGMAPDCVGIDHIGCEYWTGEELGAEIDRQAEFLPEMIVEGYPRRWNLPVTLYCFDPARRAFLDGRHRIARWRTEGGRFPVFVLNGWDQ